MKLVTQAIKTLQRRALVGKIKKARPDLAGFAFKDLLDTFIEQSVAAHVANQDKSTDLPALVQQAVDYLSTETDRYYHTRLLVSEQENRRLRILLDESQETMTRFEQIANQALDIAQGATGSRPSLN